MNELDKPPPLRAHPVDNSDSNPIYWVYLRVSRQTQDNQNQESGVLAWLNANNATRTQFTRENVSSMVPWRDRALAQALETARPGDYIVAAEFSRLGRSTLDVLQFLEAAATKAVKVIITKNNMHIGDDLPSRLLSYMMTIASEIEIGFTRARTKEAIGRIQAEIAEKGFYITKSGQRRASLGRQVGQVVKSKVQDSMPEILRLHSARTAASAIARLLGVHPSTIRKAIAAEKAKAGFSTGELAKSLHNKTHTNIPHLLNPRTLDPIQRAAFARAHIAPMIDNHEEKKP